MSYLVLARRFRPQSFEAIIGQEHITRALQRAVVRNKVPHAVLFCGPRGVGKTTAARVFARALNCTGRQVSEEAPKDGAAEEAAMRQVEPCGECVNCQEIAKSVSLSVWEVDGASNNSVENVRTLIDSLRSLPPPGSRYKIYIIDEVHMLSTAAFNALLKSLEEPPPHTVFVFATTEPHKIPETVLSRCQRHDFRRLSFPNILLSLRSIVAQEGVAVDEKVLRLIARRAEGGLRDAQTLLDRVLPFCSSGTSVSLEDAQRIFGVVDVTFCNELIDAVIAKDVSKALSFLDSAFSRAVDIEGLVGEIVEHLRNLMIVCHSGGDIKELGEMLKRDADELAELKQQAEKVSSFDAVRLFDLAEELSRTASRSYYPRFVIEAFVVKMAMLPDLTPLGDLVTRLEGALAQSGGQDRSRSAGTAPAPARPAPVRQESPAPQKGAPASEPEPHVTHSTPEVGNVPLPSWERFLDELRDANEMVLSTVLRRSRATEFRPGALTIEAQGFDLGVLREQGRLAALKKCLAKYGSAGAWTIKINEYGAELREGDASMDPALSRAVPGSLEAEDARRRGEEHEQLQQSLRNHPAVQSALQVFEGSRIEKVSVKR